MNIERIATLIASGLKPSNVASIVGCSPSLISQLARDNKEFQNLLLLKEAEFKESDVEEVALSAKYHSAEHALLDQVLQMAPTSELREVTAALRVVAERQDKAKTRLNPIQGSSAVINNVIQLYIPSHAIPELNMTKEREVISIDNISLAPLTSTGVTNLFKKMKEDKEEIYNESRRLPTVNEETLRETTLSEETITFLDSREDFIEAIRA